jgi:hypothetical protein
MYTYHGRIERIAFTAATPLLAISTCDEGNDLRFRHTQLPTNYELRHLFDDLSAAAVAHELRDGRVTRG